MHPGIGEDVPLVTSVRLSTESFGSFNEIIQSALSLGQIGALALGDAVRNPVDDQCLRPLVPHRIVDRIAGGVDDVESLFGGSFFSMHNQLGRRIVLHADGREFKHVLARHREGCGCIGGRGVRKDNPARS